MENSTLQSPYFHLVVLFLCFILFKILNIVRHTFKSIKNVITEIHEGFPYFFINDAC